MAKLRREIIEPKSGGGGGKGEGFDVARTGDARIGFVGFPSVGKSTLLSNLAGVYSEVAAYEFTTLTTVPGVIRYKVGKFFTLPLNSGLQSSVPIGNTPIGNKSSVFGKLSRSL